MWQSKQSKVPNSYNNRLFLSFSWKDLCEPCNLHTDIELPVFAGGQRRGRFIVKAKNLARPNLAHRLVARIARGKEASTVKPQCVAEFSETILDLGLFKSHP